MLKIMHILTPVNKVTKKMILKFNVGDCMRISKYKNIFVKSYTLNQSEEVFGNKKVENTVPWTIVNSDLIGEEIIGMFYKKELQKQIKQSLELKKYPREIMINYISNGKAIIILFIARLIRKMLLYKVSKYFLNQYESFGKNVKVGLELSNYAAKADLKGAFGVDRSNLAAKSDLARLKAEVRKIDAGKLKTVTTDLSQPINVVGNDVVKNNFV